MLSCWKYMKVSYNNCLINPSIFRIINLGPNAIFFLHIKWSVWWISWVSVFCVSSLRIWHVWAVFHRRKCQALVHPYLMYFYQESDPAMSFSLGVNNSNSNILVLEMKCHENQIRVLSAPNSEYVQLERLSYRVQEEDSWRTNRKQKHFVRLST